jgi:hypothetical protein
MYHVHELINENDMERRFSYSGSRLKTHQADGSGAEPMQDEERFLYGNFSRQQYRCRTKRSEVCSINCRSVHVCRLFKIYIKI